MNDMGNKRRSLETTKPRKTGRAKPLISKGGITKKRTPYKYGGKVEK